MLKIYPIPQKDKKETSRQTETGNATPSANYQKARNIDDRLKDKYGIPPVGTDTDFENKLYGGTTNSSSGGTPTPAPLKNTPATSGTQVVGTTWDAETGDAAQQTGGAAGATGPANVGPPNAFVVLKGGGAQTVTSQEQINGLVASGRATAFEAQLASRQLAARQNAANNPTTSAPSQRGSREA